MSSALGIFMESNIIRGATKERAQSVGTREEQGIGEKRERKKGNVRATVANSDLRLHRDGTRILITGISFRESRDKRVKT